MYSSRVTMAMNGTTIECNHVILDDGFAMVPDMCLENGDNSEMVVCVDGQGFFREWELNTNCEGTHVFEAALADFGDELEVVCNADPCHIAVLEHYGDQSSSSSSSGSSDSSESGYYNGTSGSESGDSSVIETVMGIIDRRRLQGSDSSSSDATCDYDSTPEVVGLITDTCLPIDGPVSIKITCTDFHDAVVEYFDSDPYHECSGTATHTAPVTEFFDEDCEHLVACNVVAGDVYERHLDGHDAAPAVAILAS